jgi:hypothetical protein
VTADSGQSTGATSTSTSSSSTAPSVSVLPTFEEQAIWPFASSGTVFSTPEDAAKSFAVDYLGMTNARLGATNDENGTKNIEVFPNDRGTTRTVVRVVEQPPRGWVVFEARADEIQVEKPVRNDPVTSPLTVSGQGTAFEATLAVELRPFGTKDNVFKDIVMAGANGQMGPFSTSITPPSTDQPLVLVLFESDASGQQEMTKATVIGLTAAGSAQPTAFYGTTSDGTVLLLDFSGHQQSPTTDPVPVEPAQLPANVSGSLPTTRGRFGTVAFFDGTSIASYNPATSAVVKLVTPAATPVSLDADESGRFLIWVDTNHDVWTWSGGQPTKVATGFNAAAW